MSRIFPHATKANPCTICGKTDWCQFGDRAQICMRVESQWPAKNGGHYHYYAGSVAPRIVSAPRRERTSAPTIDCEAILARSREAHQRSWTESLAAELGVSTDALNAVQATWSDHYEAWLFPMMDGDGSIVGLRTRQPNGEKRAVYGSRQGIFIPDDELKQPIVYLVEGPTDTAAILTMGLFAIGRPNNVAGAEAIRLAMRRLRIFRAVIVADSDEMDSKLKRRPGIFGAEKLKSDLKEFPTCIWVPPAPCKDARAFLQAGGCGELITSDINKKVWTKG